ncbi:MAG: Cna B-type domain-containing protein, partial [Clostridia bacterium]|nr:Cna B-type domain-containing protein [Clostridia bacterium]
MKTKKASTLQRFWAIALTLILLLQTMPGMAEGLVVYSEEISLFGEGWEPDESGDIDITANVIWHDDSNKGPPPSQVTLHLLANGLPYEGENASVLVSAGNGWTYTWPGLPRYIEEQEIAYTVTQDAVSDFYTAYETNAQTNALEITNIRLDGSLNLRMISGHMFRVRFDGDASMTAVITFEPYIAGHPENLRVILPPFFRLTALPRAGDGYQVDVRDVPLPKEFYPMAAADLLKSFPADKTMCQQILVSFDETIDSEFVLTLGMKTMDYKSLGELMTLYGTQPHSIPLKIVTMAEDVQGNRLDYAELLSDSTITNASGAMPFETQLTYPNLNSNGYITHRIESSDYAGYEVKTLQLYARAYNHFLARLEPWHYPYTDLVYYVPCPEPLAVTGFMNLAYTPGPDDYITLNGKRYLRIPYTDMESINTAYSFPASGMFSDSLYMVTYMFPDLDTVRPGDLYEFGDVYISYTHKGVNYGVGGDQDPIRIWTIDDYTITNNRRNLSTWYSFWDKNMGGSGGYGNNHNLSRRLQGLDGDKYMISMSNSTWSQLAYTYEEADVTIEFPFEVTPTAITYEATNLLANSFQSYVPHANERMYPTSVTYWVRDTAEPQTAALGATQSRVTFPAGAHVSKVSFHYPEIPPYMRTMSFEITANNASTYQNGAELPNEHYVSFNTTVTTASGMRVTAAKDPAKRMEEWFNYSVWQPFYLVRPTDSLRFGIMNYYGNTATTVNNRNQTGIANMPSPHYGYNTYSAPEPVTSPMSDPYPWAFALMKTDGQMQDYEDVVITITAPSDGKAMEKLRGFDIGHSFHTISSQLTVEYTTNRGNRSHTLRPANNNFSNGRSFLNLMAGEHVLAGSEVRIRLGTLYGDEMSPFGANFQNTPAGLDTTIGRWNLGGNWWWNPYYIAPFFSGAHTYADGTALNPVDQMVATITTSTEAQFINEVPGKSPVFNNKAVGAIHNVTAWTSNVHVRRPAESVNWNEPTKTFYPNTDVSFDLRLYNLGLLDDDRQGEIIDHLNQYKQFDFGGMLLYMEVADGFALSGVEGYTIQEIRNIPGSQNKLYIFAANSFDAPIRIWWGDQFNYYNSNNFLNFFNRVNVYAQPDVALSTELTPIIISAGLSMDAFAAKYMTPADGDDAYYNAPPFHVINFVGDSFPDYWGVEDAAIQLLIPDVDIASSVIVQMASLDRVSIRPGASGLISSVNTLTFQDYQIDTLTAKAWMKNSSDRTIALYEAVYQLPRLEMPTLGSGTTSKQMFSNDYPLYLRGPVQYDPSIIKEIIYYDGFEGTGNPVNITASSSIETLRSVQSFVVIIENLEANRAGIVDIPLYTDYEKRGAETEELKAYVGVKRRFQPDPSIRMSVYAYSSPAEFVYMSRNLHMNIFFDANETGSALSNGHYQTSGDAYPIVYYMGADGVERVLYNGQNRWDSQYNILVNSDVTRVEMHNRHPEVYGYTLMNAPGVGQMFNSNFPRNDPDKPVELMINYDDLRGVNHANRRYDLGLFVLPVAGSQDVYVRVNGSKAVELYRQHPWRHVSDIQDKRFTTFDLDYQGYDAAIAELTAAGWVTGKQVGITGYSATVSNTFSLTDQALPSDTVPASGNIYVMDSFRVALRMYFDNDFDSKFTEGDEPVLFPDWETASQYLWLGDEWRHYLVDIEDPHYCEETGYFSFELLDPASYVICARSPFPYDLGTEGSVNFSRISPIGDRNDPHKGNYWISYQSGREEYILARMQQDFSATSASFEDGAVTVSIDFALQKPVTVTFRARNGEIIGGYSSGNRIRDVDMASDSRIRDADTGSEGGRINDLDMASADDSAVQYDAEGSFIQHKMWPSDWLELFSYYAGVEPNQGYVWPEVMYDWGEVDRWGSGDIRKWAQVINGQDVVRTESEWSNSFYGEPITGDVTFWALPFRPVYLHVKTFDDTNGNNVYDEGETNLAYPFQNNSELTWMGTYDEATGYWRYMVEPGTLDFLFAPLTSFYEPPFERRYHGEKYALRYNGETTMHDMPHQMLLTDLALGAVPVTSFSLDLSVMAPETDIYLEIPMRKPHTVTFKTEHGSIGPSPMGWELLIRFINPFDPVQKDANGHPYMQVDYFHGNWLTLGMTDQNLYLNPELRITQDEIDYFMAWYQEEIFPIDTFNLFVEVTTGMGYLWPSNPNQRMWKCLETGETRSEINWRHYPVTQDLTFVAQPRRIFYTVNYLPNGEGITGETDDGEVYFKNDTAEVIGPEFTLPAFPGTSDPYYEFVGWNTKPDGSGAWYTPYESTFTFDEDDLFLYAQWKALYRVEHYLQSDFDPQAYDLVTEHLVVAYAEPGKLITAEPREYDGYRYIAELSNTSGDVMMPTISPETWELEILRLKLFYEKLPQLDIAKTAGNLNPRMGEAVTYRLTVTNNGTGPARNVIVADALAQGLTFISATPQFESDGDALWNGSEVTWDIPMILPGASATLNVLVRVNAEVGARIPNTAKITGEFGKEFDDPIEDDEEILVSEPLFIITKVTDKAEAYVGDTVQYTISVTNASADAMNIVIRDQVPDPLVDLTVDSSHQVWMNGNDIDWTIPALAKDQSVTLTITGRIDPSTNATSITNVAQIVSEDGAGFDENSRPTSQPAVTQILRPALDITKEALQPEARTGETVAFSVVVSNSGNGDAQNVVVIDTLPEGLQFVSADALDPIVEGPDGNITWTIANLPAMGGEATMTVEALVVAQSGKVTNTATIASENGPTATADIEVKNPSLTITKVADVTEAYAGDMVTYTVTVQNTGSAPAVEIVINDILPNGLKNIAYQTDTGNTMFMPADGLLLLKDQVVWMIPSLGVGESAQLEITAQIDAQPGVITNIAVLKNENGADITEGPFDTADVEVLQAPTYTLAFDPNGG